MVSKAEQALLVLADYQGPWKPSNRPLSAYQEVTPACSIVTHYNRTIAVVYGKVGHRIAKRLVESGKLVRSQTEAFPNQYNIDLVASQRINLKSNITAALENLGDITCEGRTFQLDTQIFREGPNLFSCCGEVAIEVVKEQMKAGTLKHGGFTGTDEFILFRQPVEQGK